MCSLYNKCYTGYPSQLAWNYNILTNSIIEIDCMRVALIDAGVCIIANKW